MIPIKEYKGFDISFDEIAEKFTASGCVHDKYFVKTSIAALKKAINDFNSANLNFGEFKFQETKIDYDGLPKIYTAIGVTTNKKLKYQDSDGNVSTLSKYDLDRFIIYREANQPLFQEQLKFQEERIKIEREYNNKIREVGKLLDSKTIGDFIKESGMDIDTRDKWE